MVSMTESYSTMILHTHNLQPQAPAKQHEMGGGDKTSWPGTAEVRAGRGTFYLINHIAPVHQGRQEKMSCC